MPTSTPNDGISPGRPVSANEALPGSGQREHQDRQPGNLLSAGGHTLGPEQTPLVHDVATLLKLGADMGNLFAEFMIKQIDAGEIEAVDAPAFASRCAAGVYDVRQDMQGDGYSDTEIGIYIEACMSRMGEMFSAYRSGLLATSDHKVRN
jgi:hypothetical protein